MSPSFLSTLATRRNSDSLQRLPGAGEKKLASRLPWIGLLSGISWLFSPLSHADQFGDFTYDTTATEVHVTGYTGAGGAVEIPSTIAGLPVVSVYGFQGQTAITSVDIPDGVLHLQTARLIRSG